MSSDVIMTTPRDGNLFKVHNLESSSYRFLSSHPSQFADTSLPRVGCTHIALLFVTPPRAQSLPLLCCACTYAQGECVCVCVRASVLHHVAKSIKNEVKYSEWVRSIKLSSKKRCCTCAALFQPTRDHITKI